MSKINFEDLKKAAFSSKNANNNFPSSISNEKKERIEACKKLLENKLKDMRAKYFDDKWEYSINNSLIRGCKNATDPLKNVDVYMNFSRGFR